eukprot:CAMPEP_0183296430 /NCGR_PEP_ID=MMETSP0160_2-20130417/3987_1 /TAXON_ID=2839 ORGANISM="Odontella Sinensis, Strain Grunow 1884" /NCGR_SAMPLE_ID=MMETSP0160_2 /ASSEMBLY_ACC=CAM_ASM_000250 /LENGTH=105 /DNA_ID=CAMNT_0025458039 /DNA_START=40 /DNA_END=357 /DNA_ORIENTATION=+
MPRALLQVLLTFLATGSVAPSSIRGASSDGKEGVAVARGKLDCLLHGWEKPDCLTLHGCAWCDTAEYGGACVTAAFAKKVKESSWFNCTDPSKHVSLTVEMMDLN